MLTGPVAHLGELQQNGVSLAVEKINDAGGINGRKIEIVVEDSAYDPKQAVSAYQALKSKGLRNFIIDGSPIVSSTRKLVVDDGNFTIAVVATTPSYFDGYNNTCRLALTAKNLAPAAGDLALKNNYKKVALLLPDNDYGRGFADEFIKDFDKKGEVIATEFYASTQNTNDFRTNITKIKSVQSEIDAIVFSQILNNIEPMLQQMKTLGLTKPLVSEFPTMTNPALKDLSLVEGAIFVDSEFSKNDLPTDSIETKAFKDAYRAKYNSDPILFAAAHYDAVFILTQAIKEVGEDPQKIADYVSNLKNYNGVTGFLSFDNDCEIDRNVTFKKIENGQIVDMK